MRPAYGTFRATELFCPRCRQARPVRERLLLVLPGTDLLDYRCQVCGESCGTREVPQRPPVPPSDRGTSGLAP